MPSDTPRTRPPAAAGLCHPALKRGAAIILTVALTACGGAATPPPAPAVPPPPAARPAPAAPLVKPAPEPAAPSPAAVGGGSYMARGKRYHILASAEGFTEQGLGVLYADSLHGRRTSSGEKYDTAKLTAAHKTLPMGTLVEVRNLENNKTVIVRINDRGPFSDEHVIDVSRAAARALGMRQTIRVSLRAVSNK